VGRINAIAWPVPAGWYSLLLIVWLGLAASTDAATLVLTGPDGAPVTLNAEELGQFPLPGPLTLEAGHYLVKCELSGYQKFEQEVRLNSEDDWIHLRVRLTPLSKKTAMLTNLLIAGSGQRYLGKRTKGWIFTGAEIGGLVLAIYGDVSYQNHKNDYLIAMDNYRRAVSEEDIARHRQEAADAFAAGEDALSLRDTGLYMAVGAIALSVLDAWLFFPEVVAGAGPGPVGSHPGTPDLNSFHIASQIRF
jgi:hypothetical protein